MEGSQRYGVCVLLEETAKELISVLQRLRSSLVNVHSRTGPEPGALCPADSLECLGKGGSGRVIHKMNVSS